MPTYSDLSLYPSPVTAIDIDAIKNSIDLCLEYAIKERLNNPQFGCDLHDLLFEPIDEETADLILFVLLSCIPDWDPRLRIVPAKSIVTPFPDYNRYDISLVIEVYFEGQNQNQRFEYFSSLRGQFN